MFHMNFLSWLSNHGESVPYELSVMAKQPLERVFHMNFLSWLSNHWREKESVPYELSVMDKQPLERECSI